MSKVTQFIIVAFPTIIAGMLGHLWFTTSIPIGLSFMGGALFGWGILKLRKAELEAIKETQAIAANMKATIKQGEGNDLDAKN